MSQRLLAILAHPDDEAFGMGGTLARYAANGVSVHLICATKGEAGKITDPSIDPNIDKGKLREQELQESCKALGIHEPIFLGYLDSGRFERTQHNNSKALMNIDEIELECALLDHLVALQPDILIGFDPHGIYGHIDHIKMHRATTAAFWSSSNRLAQPPRRLFYTAIATSRMKQAQIMRENSPFSKLDANVYGVSETSFAALIDVKAYLTHKQAAIAAHRSQTGPQSSFAGLSEDEARRAWEEMMSLETFTLGGLRGSFPEMPLTDLFAGLS
jgi:N-acetyl-1-D-myo-inositol-2-amino-2-deoxy-alpha-D-glucopyranoside deacetylase